MRAQGSSPQLSSVKCVFIGQLIFSATGGNDEISRLESRVRVIEFWILAVVAMGLCYILLGAVSSWTAGGIVLLGLRYCVCECAWGYNNMYYNV